MGLVASFSLGFLSSRLWLWGEGETASPGACVSYDRASAEVVALLFLAGSFLCF